MSQHGAAAHTRERLAGLRRPHGQSGGGHGGPGLPVMSGSWVYIFTTVCDVCFEGKLSIFNLVKYTPNKYYDRGFLSG